MSTNFASGTVWTGDNLPIMRGMNSASVDLIYLDPPFNSNRHYEAPMTPPIQTGFKTHAGSSEMPTAEILGISQPKQGSSQSPALELQVKIADQDHSVQLPVDALPSYGIGGPAAVDELRKIRELLERLVPAGACNPETG